MTYDSLILYLYIALVLLLGGGGLLFFLILRRARRDEVWRSLNLKLFRVSFPRARPPEQGLTLDELKSRIGAMEKIYASLYGVREPWWRVFLYGRPGFALEITVPHIGEEITFYLAVPKRLSLSVEKIIEGVFSEAQVEAVADYNIFNPDGASAASVLKLKSSFILPIKTYRELEGDPLKELTSVFSRLRGVGEGAALQIVARPAPKKAARQIMNHAKSAYLGKVPVAPGGVLSRGLKEITAALESKAKEPAAKTEEHHLSPKEEEQVKLIEAKGSKPLFET
ncbi:MAG: hypothetical protein HYT42_00440, partial [Candidatus Sungbacteria bacterium]|nr:hypothetical protein [Candidatus Sungbacteria bacterium]